MKRVAFAEAALCAALLAGSAPTDTGEYIETPQAELFPQYAQEYTPQQRALLRQQQDLIVSQEPILADTAVYLAGEEGFENCSNFNHDGTLKPADQQYALPSSGADYCPAIDTVRLSAGSVGAIALSYGKHDTAEQTGMALFLGAHELGHAKSMKEDTDPYPKVTNGAWVAYTRGSELQADCLAGRFMERTAPQLIAPTVKALMRMPSLKDDPSHGGNIARSQSFKAGADGDACKHKGNIQDYPDILHDPGLR